MKKEYPFENIVEFNDKSLATQAKNEKEIQLIDEEINMVKELKNKIGKKLKAIKKNNFFLTYDDIMDKNGVHNYIAVKSSEDDSPDIQIVNEDDIEKGNIQINQFEENFINNFNINLNSKKNINNFSIYDFDSNINEYQNNTNINNLIKSNLDREQSPIELFFISQENSQSEYNNVDINNYKLFNNVNK